MKYQPISAADIDIDLSPSSTQPFNWVRASMVDQKTGGITPHPVGWHPQELPIHKDVCAIPHKAAEDLGFLKVDFLPNAVYATAQSHEQVCRLAETEPRWPLLEDQSVVQTLFQLGAHADYVLKAKPRSVSDLAELIAIIRPAKAHLKELYLTDRNAARALLWTKEPGTYGYKKSSATAYALAICVQLNSVAF